MDQQQSPQVNSNKIYVGNLSWNLGEADLRELCEPFGDLVEVSLVTDRATGRSRGFGFVTFVDEAAAAKAIEELHDREVDGRKLFVKVARPKEESGDRPRRSFGQGSGGGYNRGPRQGGFDSNRGGGYQDRRSGGGSGFNRGGSRGGDR